MFSEPKNEHSQNRKNDHFKSQNVTGQEMYGFVPRTNGKPKTYIPTTSKDPNVLAGHYSIMRFSADRSLQFIGLG